MPRPTLRWINTAVLEGALRGDPRAREGAERVLRTGARDERKFTMLIRQGFKDARRGIRQHARRKLHALNLLTEMCADADDSGYLELLPADYAHQVEIPLVTFYGCLVDLAAIEVLVVDKRRGRIQGVQLSEKIFRPSRPKPRKLRLVPPAQRVPA